MTKPTGVSVDAPKRDTSKDVLIDRVGEFVPDHTFDAKHQYMSPRWTGELCDCSMPLTFDTYSACSYGCLYCFAFFQKSKTCRGYMQKEIRAVSVTRIRNLFNNILAGLPDDKLTMTEIQFKNYIGDRRVMQWGGMSDPLDEYEREYGVTLELLKFFDEIDYPLSISTKGAWWTEDERYMSIIRKHPHNWHFKISVITYDPLKAALIERGVDSPAARLAAIRRLTDMGIHVTLRLRPYLIGVSDDWKTLVYHGWEAGADSVTTEFFCLEMRAKKDGEIKIYEEMSKVCGYDILAFYKKHSRGGGYIRLNYELKRPIINAMRDYVHSLGMAFLVSDAHHKEKSDYTCCCGVPPAWNWSGDHFAGAMQIAKNSEDGLVHWSDIAEGMERICGHVPFGRAEQFNSSGSKTRARKINQSLADHVHNAWNDYKSGKSPYVYFGGVLYPVGTDEHGDLIYKYNRDLVEGVAK